MLDKSIPHFSVAMVLPQSEQRTIHAPALPDGYRYAMYTPDGMAHWAAIEASVGEFESEQKAQVYFKKEFLPHPEALAQRMVFVLGPDDQPVATTSAWWLDDAAMGRVHLIHWVAVRQGMHGLGLGRAVVCKALSLFPTLGLETGGRNGDIWLNTQT